MRQDGEAVKHPVAFLHEPVHRGALPHGKVASQDNGPCLGLHELRITRASLPARIRVSRAPRFLDHGSPGPGTIGKLPQRPGF